MQPEARIFVVRNDRHRTYAVQFLGTLEPPFEISVARVQPQRTLQQNARLWLLHTEAGRVTGYSPEEMHEFALCRHFGHREISLGEFGSERIVRTIPLKRSSTRNIQEFTEFMESTEAWYGTTFGVWLQEDRPLSGSG